MNSPLTIRETSNEHEDTDVLQWVCSKRIIFWIVNFPMIAMILAASNMGQHGKAVS